jgi:ribosomal-protein-alanine N-acetyltransferase
MIRPGTPADGPRLHAIQDAVLDSSWPDLLSAGLDGPPLVLVATAGEPVGYALTVFGREAAYLAELAVAPAAQGNGHGSRLLAAVLDRAPAAGVETVRLTTRADDPELQGFYAQAGFAVVERVPDHYDDGDAVVMARPVTTDPPPEAGGYRKNDS